MSVITMNRKLNLVIPVDVSPGVTYWVHSTPISLDVFETYHQPIALAYSRLLRGGMAGGALRVAAMTLRATAKELGMWDGREGVKEGLFAEINRISNVIMPAAQGGGWTVISLDDALRKDLFDKEDASELENAIAFFIVASSMSRKGQQKIMLEAVGDFWGLQSTSLNSTEYKDGLPTSTATESIGEKPTAIVSRIPH